VAGAEAVIGVSETALLVPVREAEPLVRHHRHEMDPVAPLGVPAHVTVLYPFLPPEDVDNAVCDAIAEVVDGFRAFDFALQEVRRFPDGVVYLAPEPTAPFVEITDALVARWPDFPPYGGAYATVIPHLTVAQTNGSDDVAALEAELNGGLPIPALADAVWLMEGQPKDRWAIRAVFPLPKAERG
jgi:2'-5' RNA ligase